MAAASGGPARDDSRILLLQATADVEQRMSYLVIDWEAVLKP
jgi:hypothetical protein